MPPPGPLFSLSPPRRHPGLDAARSLAVAALVLGHTLGALLLPEVRAGGWGARLVGLADVAAPLFLTATGFGLVAALGQVPDAARLLWGARLRSALALVALGYAVHLPALAVVGAALDGAGGWAPLLTFDAPQCVGLCLALGASALVLARGWALRTGVLLALALAFVLGTPWLAARAGALPVGLSAALVGPAAHFPLAPWAACFFLGALAAHLTRALAPGGPQGLASLAVGGVLLLAACFVPADAAVVLRRAALACALLGAVCLLPAPLTRPLAPLGRVSLGVYLLHVPLLSGWADRAGLAARVGPTGSLALALGVGLGVLALAFALAWAWDRLTRLAVGGRRRASRPSGVPRFPTPGAPPRAVGEWTSAPRSR